MYWMPELNERVASLSEAAEAIHASVPVGERGLDYTVVREDGSRTTVNAWGNAVELVNATPHAVSVFNCEGWLVAQLPASGLVLRAEEQREPREPVVVWGMHLPVSSVTFGAVVACRDGQAVEVPGPVPRVLYVVSALVRLAAGARVDFVSPGPVFRDAEGRPVGCVGFTR